MECSKDIDKSVNWCYNVCNQTDEAEIKVIMPPQRACAAESQVKRRSSNGPLRVQSNGDG